MWQAGSKLLHPFNPELGVGMVLEVDGRYLHVHFPDVDQQMTLAAEGAGIQRLVIPKGSPARLASTGEEVVVADVGEHVYRLADGRECPEADVWPISAADTPVERLAGLRLDSVEALKNRIAGLELMELREAGGLGSFLGGRIELFPHQLHTAQRAVASDPVRWLLADEVGLGKTVEACLILSALLRTGRAERALVVAPATLAVQWLGELYRKFHQVFVLLDAERLASVESDYGKGVNPFEVHPFAVLPLEWAQDDAHLLRQAEEAGLDLVVVDEAHRFFRGENEAALSQIVGQARHTLLLTATPFQEDRPGFFKLLSLLHPEAFDDYEAFEKEVARGEVVVPCTSSVRRSEVGGLPPRVATPIEVGSPEDELRRDPRALWLAEQVPRWTKAGEKCLVFVRGLERLQQLVDFLESSTRVRVNVFHEELSLGSRDIEIASFRESKIPLLLSTEVGGEGRNFQFCHRMLHFDLPPDPVELEQRIGRLDRIGRERPVEILYFLHPEGDAQKGAVDLARLYERLGLFERPASGLDTALASVRPAIEAAASSTAPLDVDALVESVASAREATRERDIDVHYRDSYRKEMAEEVLAQVPTDLEARTRALCLEAAEDLGIECVEKGGTARYYFEMGSSAVIETLPGVAADARFLGTFDRAEAVAVEELDFFASGHELVEGFLLELEDGGRGRAAMLDLPRAALPGPGLACVYKDGASWSVAVVSADGEAKPEWSEPLLASLPSARRSRPERRGIGRGWAEGVRALAEKATGQGRLVAVLFFFPDL